MTDTILNQISNRSTKIPKFKNRRLGGSLLNKEKDNSINRFPVVKSSPVAFMNRSKKGLTKPTLTGLEPVPAGNPTGPLVPTQRFKNRSLGKIEPRPDGSFNERDIVKSYGNIVEVKDPVTGEITAITRNLLGKSATERSIASSAIRPKRFKNRKIQIDPETGLSTGIFLTSGQRQKFLNRKNNQFQPKTLFGSVADVNQRFANKRFTNRKLALENQRIVNQSKAEAESLDKQRSHNLALAGHQLEKDKFTDEQDRKDKALNAGPGIQQLTNALDIASRGVLPGFDNATQNGLIQTLKAAIQDKVTPGSRVDISTLKTPDGLMGLLKAFGYNDDFIKTAIENLPG